ncbi:hypothetical protein SBOR_6156 [Sclerotinia borealis F-4128]|uniref:Uncharacterized protein n=1 Tax=Sclerotinia borealis (strain F-4128) TaxID=1432307 RepID=W9CFA7_SCLBF|nr:hypothetical protein SBOR_6156 [Sclerotinia borealis F-4128]
MSSQITVPRLRRTSRMWESWYGRELAPGYDGTYRPYTVQVKYSNYEEPLRQLRRLGEIKTKEEMERYFRPPFYDLCACEQIGLDKAIVSYPVSKEPTVLSDLCPQCKAYLRKIYGYGSDPKDGNKLTKEAFAELNYIRGAHREWILNQEGKKYEMQDLAMYQERMQKHWRMADDEITPDARLHRTRIYQLELRFSRKTRSMRLQPMNFFLDEVDRVNTLRTGRNTVAKDSKEDLANAREETRRINEQIGQSERDLFGDIETQTQDQADRELLHGMEIASLSDEDKKDHEKVTEKYPEGGF